MSVEPKFHLIKALYASHGVALRTRINIVVYFKIATRETLVGHVFDTFHFIFVNNKNTFGNLQCRILLSIAIPLSA